MVDESVTVKGSPVRSLQKFLEERLTPEQRREVLAVVPPEFAARFQAGLHPTEAIPVHLLNRLISEAARVLNEPLEQFARAAGREGAADAVEGIYRFFAGVLTPDAVLGKAAQMWKTLYNRGQLAVDEQTSNSARVRLLDFPSEVAGCERMTGWIERMAEMTNIRDVAIEQTNCYAKGAACCEWRLSWR
jgi:predicted hydrocarbon binding protein